MGSPTVNVYKGVNMIFKYGDPMNETAKVTLDFEMVHTDRWDSLPFNLDYKQIVVGYENGEPVVTALLTTGPDEGELYIDYITSISSGAGTALMFHLMERFTEIRLTSVPDRSVVNWYESLGFYEDPDSDYFPSYEYMWQA